MLELSPTLSVTLAPLVGLCGGSVPLALERVAQAGVRCVQVSAATKGLRPQDLDTQGRREVLALLARRGLALGGLDLMIPHKDFLDSSRQDRAVAAVLQAITLAGDWGRVPLCVSLPVEELPHEITQALLAKADGTGVTLAVHAEHDIAALLTWLRKHDQPVLRAAMDPAALIAAGHDPADVAMKLADFLAVARLDDFARTSITATGGRCPVGGGELDLLRYRAALAAARRLRAIVIELRDLSEPFQGIPTALHHWSNAAKLIA